MRNPKVGSLYCSVDRFVLDSFEKLFRRLAQEGRIAPDLDIPTVAKLFSMIGDGMCVRRATDPDFDAKRVMPAVMALIGKLLNPQRTTGDKEPRR
jgi:TetR/AcrR family transcriptional regulator, repressor for uid operon